MIPGCHFICRMLCVLSECHIQMPVHTLYIPISSYCTTHGFYIFFQDILPANKMLGALLLWRFFTYYLSLIVGLGCVVWDSSSNMKKKKEELQEKVDNIT